MISKETRQTIRELLDSETFELTDAKGAIRNLLNELDETEEENERLQEENQRLWEALEKVNRYNSDTVTNDRRIRHIIGQIVDEALKGRSE